jgi:hypothetical protein
VTDPGGTMGSREGSRGVQAGPSATEYYIGRGLAPIDRSSVLNSIEYFLR